MDERYKYGLIGKSILAERYQRINKDDYKSLFVGDYSNTQPARVETREEAQMQQYDIKRYVQEEIYHMHKKYAYIIDKLESEIHSLKKNNEGMRNALMDLAKVIDEIQNNHLEPLGDLE